MHMRQLLRLTHSSIPLDIITDTACDNASRRRTRCRGTYLLCRTNHARVIVAFRIVEKPCEHDDISDRT